MKNSKGIMARVGSRCAVAATVLVSMATVWSCAKDEVGERLTEPGVEVLVRLPGVSLAAPVSVVPGGMPSGAASRSGVAGYSALGGFFGTEGSRNLFSVRLGDEGTDSALSPAACAGAAGTSRAGDVAAGDIASGAAAGIFGDDAGGDDALPATRADVALSNVWVFQFDASGKAVRCEKVATLVVGHPLDARLNSGEGYTIGVVAGGPADGLSTSTVPDLATFREGLLFTGGVASDEAIPYAGTLDGVTVLPTGQVQVGGSAANVPYITLKRILAKVTVDLTHDVDDYALDGVELYCVPVGAPFASDPAASAFPAGEDANFAYRSNAAAGLAPHAQSGGNYTWYVGPNRRGKGTGIVTVQDKNASKAPAYATYARVKTHNTTDEDAPLYYDIYLGEDMFTDFNITANHVYNYATRIVGTAAEHCSLIDTDGRVSGKKPRNVDGATVTPSGDIPGEGGTYSVTLTGLLPDGGVEVRASRGGSGLVSGKVTESGKSVALTVPANTGYASRTVAFEYKWNGTWTRIGEERSQEGYNVTDKSVSSTATINGAGESRSVTLTGYLPSSVPVRAIVSGTSSALVSGNVSKSGTAVSLAIPANDKATERTVVFQYQWNGTWTEIARCQQAVGPVQATISPDPSKGFSADAMKFNITLTGNLGSGIPVRAIVSGQSAALATATANVSGRGVQLTVPANSYPNPARTVVFQYQENGSWKEIKRGTQAAGENIDTGGGGTVLEPDPGKLVTWEEAIAYCSSKGPGWRLPTQNELLYYECVRPSLEKTAPFETQFTWTGTLYWYAPTEYAYTLKHDDGNMTWGRRTQAAYGVRCAKDN